MAARKLNPDRNIVRVDYRTEHGFRVVFTRGSRGINQIRVVEHFADSNYRSLTACLRAARRRRDELERQIPAPLKPQMQRRIGAGWVKRTIVQRRAGPSEVMLGWVRLEDGRPASTSRSIEAWGEDEALREILAWLRAERRAIVARMGTAAPAWLQRIARAGLVHQGALIDG